MSETTKRKFNPNEFQVIGTCKEIDEILAAAKRERWKELWITAAILFAVVVVTVLVGLAVTT